MSNLDDKLREILILPAERDGGRAKINAIKQAFADEGWLRVDQAAEYITHNKLMTGQAFYDRFSQQFRGTPGGTIVTLNIDEVMKAARKAAGLE